MTTWNERTLPYPILAPWTDDYGEATFDASLPKRTLNNGKAINLLVKCHLTSDYLGTLIDEGQATYYLVMTCRSTFMRHHFQADQDDEFVIPLAATDYSDEIRVTPYVVATSNIPNFQHAEHAAEFRTFRPGGFFVPLGSILAVGDSSVVIYDRGTIHSLIDLVADSKIRVGSFAVNLNGNRIRIYVSQSDRHRIESLRQRGSLSLGQVTLFPALYLHAVVEAIGNLLEEDYQDKRWNRTIAGLLEDQHIVIDPHTLKDNALLHAQTLMHDPVGPMLKLLTTHAEED